MANYFYKWTPVFIVGTILLLGLPWLGLIALVLVALVLLGALATLAFAIAWAIGTLSQKIRVRWQVPSGTGQGMSPALSPARFAHRSAPLVPIGATLMSATRAFRRDS